MLILMDELISVEFVSKNLKEWEEFHKLLGEKIQEAKGNDVDEIQKILYKKIKKERRKLDKLYGAPTDPYERDWYDWLQDSSNWEEIDYPMLEQQKCDEESCREKTEEKGKKNSTSFYRAKGDDKTILCEECYNERDEDDNIIWAKRQVLYWDETIKQKEKRSKDREEWYEDVDEIENGDWHDIKCVEDECWYKNNLDRMSGYGIIYVFRGYEREIILCDVCFDNGSYNDLDYWMFRGICEK